MPTLTVAENLFLGRLPTRMAVSRRRLPALAQEAFDRWGRGRPGRHGRLAAALRAAAGRDRQGTHGSRQVAHPGAHGVARRPGERPALSLVKKLSAEGISVIYITHRLKEIARVGHRVTVLRDGKYVGGVGHDEIEDNNRLVELMTGRKRRSSILARRGAPATNGWSCRSCGPLRTSTVSRWSSGPGRSSVSRGSWAPGSPASARPASD